MKTAKKLREKLEKDIKKLQFKCIHPSSTWAEQWLAIAHPAGNIVRICNICEKILENKSLDITYTKKNAN